MEGAVRAMALLAPIFKYYAMMCKYNWRAAATNLPIALYKYKFTL
jgi:hypothetical protein